LPIRWRLTLFNALAIAVILLVLGLSVFFAVREVLFSGVQETVRNRASSVARTLESGGPLAPGDVEQLTLEGVTITVRDDKGEVLLQTVKRGLAPQESSSTFWREVVETGEPAGGKIRSSSGADLYVYAVPVDASAIEPRFLSPAAEPSSDASPVPPPAAASVVEASKSYEPAAATVRTLGTVLVFGILALFILSVIGAYLLARAALAPVDAVIRSARGITEGDLSRRLPVERPKDEIGRLAATINDLLARLEAAFARREQALAQQRRFVADASHELRTPLTSIGGYARMLEEWGLRDAKTSREGIAAIRRDSERMRELVEGLLSLARGDEGVPMEPRRHDLGEVAAEAVASVRAAADGKVSARCVPPLEPVVATFDRARVRQAADILLDNAVKYTPEGGKVAVSVREKDGWALLEVSDTGVGIPAEQIPHVFERFYRADRARSSRGAGLGLSIARQIAEAQGGDISVESEPGKGSTFTLQIPKQAARPQA
jgi:two-component system OmpR family sensor kinase